MIAGKQVRAFPLRIWAPDAAKVEGVLEHRRVPLERLEGGWWRSAERLPAGTDYRFSVDGGEPLPSPRARWQPHGVDGPSRMLDPGSFEWSDGGWKPPPLADGVVYEAHIGTFSAQGTFEGAIGHLDSLVELGVTHLELMPVAEFSGEHGWGYDGVDLYAPHAAYGGPNGLWRLVDAAHARGLAVLLDVVYNHLGPTGNYLGRFGPYFTDRYSTPWGSAVNFDGPDSDEVRRFFIDNALMWLRDYHLDGLRLDAVHAIFDMSAVHFLEQLTAEVRQLEAELGRSLVVIAESDLNDPRLVADVARGGYGMDAQWSDDFHHALHSVLTGERTGYYEDFGTLGDLATTLGQGYRYAGDYSPFRRRRHGRPNPGLDGNRMLGYLQNHDQVGNRALGERSAELMSEGRLMIGAAVVLTAPFVPMLFQGEEWAASTPFQYFTDHHDPELGRAVSEGRRTEFAAFGWQPESVPDPQDRATFEASRLNWSERDRPDHARMLDWHRRLIRLRAEYPELRDGRLDRDAVESDDEGGWLRYRRGRIEVAFNVGAESRRLDVDPAATVLLASDERIGLDDGSLELPADTVAVLATT
ncbi:MAG TPA: malto-oligosyltrehalose trehalohydrolase [Candidatus Limnocylindrales bacterium]|nr:malto-oligosyltrehalose trehalohydrolase [Candidatus Limnocylindrales bacterium]